MKRLFQIALIATICTAPAFAAKNSKTVTFPSDVTVGSTKLPAGDYKVTWTGTGNNVQVVLQQKDANHPASATVNAQMVAQKNNHGGFTVNQKGGQSVLETIQTNDVNLILADAPAQGQ